MRYEWRGSFHHQTRRIPTDYIFSSRHKCKFGTGQCEFLSLGMAACDNSNKLCKERMVCGSNFGTSCVQSPNRSINRSSNTLNLHDLLVFRREDAGLRLHRAQHSGVCRASIQPLRNVPRTVKDADDVQPARRDKRGLLRPAGRVLLLYQR